MTSNTDQRLRELVSALETVCPIRNMTLRLNPHSMKLDTTLVLEAPGQAAALSRLRVQYADLLGECRVVNPLPWNEVLRCMSSLDFPLLERLIADDLKRVAHEISTSQGDDPVYAVFLWLDPHGSQLDYRVSCEHGFQQALRKAQSESTAYGTHSGYRIEQLRYKGYQTFSFSGSTEVHGQLAAAEKALDGLHDRFDGAALNHLSREVAQITIDVCVSAISGASEILRKRMLTTPDFAAFLQLHDETDLTEFRIARRTVPDGLLRRIMGNYYRDFLTGTSQAD
ncbi:MAG: hypothetical protein AAGA68_26020 [Pseudomonadota bacterium]